MSIFKRRVDGLTSYDFSHSKDKKLVKNFIKQTVKAPLNRSQREFIRGQITSAAKDGAGVTGREMGDIAMKMIHGSEDSIREKKAQVIKRGWLKRGVITEAEFKRAKRKYFAEEHRKPESQSHGVAQSFNECKSENHSSSEGRSFGSSDPGGKASSPPTITPPRRPMF